MSFVTDLETGLVTMLETTGAAVYPDILPQKVTYPAITYSDISDMGHQDIGIDFPRYNVTVWHERRINAKALAEEVLTLLHRYKGILNGVKVKSISKMDSPGTLYDREAEIYYVPQDFKIVYERVT